MAKGTSKARAKTDAASAVTDLDLERFRQQAAAYREADEKYNLFKKQREELQPAVKEFVDNRGEIPAKKKSKEFIDEGIKWQLVPGRRYYNEDEGAAAVKEALAKAKGARKEALALCLVSVPRIDRDAWERAKADGHVDDELVAIYEGNQAISLKWAHTDKKRCSKCDTVVARDQKFCGECGSKL